MKYEGDREGDRRRKRHGQGRQELHRIPSNPQIPRLAWRMVHGMAFFLCGWPECEGSTDAIVDHAIISPPHSKPLDIAYKSVQLSAWKRSNATRTRTYILPSSTYLVHITVQYTTIHSTKSTIPIRQSWSSKFSSPHPPPLSPPLSPLLIPMGHSILGKRLATFLFPSSR